MRLDVRKNDGWDGAGVVCATMWRADLGSYPWFSTSSRIDIPCERVSAGLLVCVWSSGCGCKFGLKTARLYDFEGHTKVTLKSQPLLPRCQLCKPPMDHGRLESSTQPFHGVDFGRFEASRVPTRASWTLDVLIGRSPVV